MGRVMLRSWVRALAWLVAPTLLLGCASTSDREFDPRDPLEPFNRATFRFNMDFDKAFVRPIAAGYRKVTPEPVDRSITNFFNNLADATSAVNNVLQFKMSRAGSDVGRLFINSTIGVLGFIDVASNVGLPSYKEDFGQTLGYWGLDPGAYLVAPLLGPTSMRDAIGRGGDLFTDPLLGLRPHQVRWGLVGVRAIDQRADLLKATEILEGSTLDPYSFVRDAYLQRRQALVYDGHPPQDQSPQDFWDEVKF